MARLFRAALALVAAGGCGSPTEIQTALPSMLLGADISALTWPVSAEGQAQFLRGVIDAVAAVPGGRGAGVVWWYPEAIEVPGLFVRGGR